MKLVNRCCVELQKCVGEPTDDQLLAMAVHPFTATHGFEELEMQCDMLRESTECDEDTKSCAKDCKKMAKDLVCV